MPTRSQAMLQMVAVVLVLRFEQSYRDGGGEGSFRVRLPMGEWGCRHRVIKTITPTLVIRGDDVISQNPLSAPTYRHATGY